MHKVIIKSEAVSVIKVTVPFTNCYRSTSQIEIHFPKYVCVLENKLTYI